MSNTEQEQGQNPGNDQFSSISSKSPQIAQNVLETCTFEKGASDFNIQDMKNDKEIPQKDDFFP